MRKDKTCKHRIEILCPLYTDKKKNTIKNEVHTAPQPSSTSIKLEEVEAAF